MNKTFNLKTIPKRVKIPMRGLKIKGDVSSKGKSEAQIEKEICSWLAISQIEYWRIKIKGDPTLIAGGKIIFKKNKNVGFSDILVCYRGVMVCLEVKKYGGIASEEQLDTQRKVRKSQGIYEFVTSVLEVQKVLLDIDMMKKGIINYGAAS